MAKKSGPKKGFKQRRKSVTSDELTPIRAGGSERSSGSSGTAGRADITGRPASSDETGDTRSKRSRLETLFNSPAVRKVMAATLVSAAGALLFNKRGGDKSGELAADEGETSSSSPSAQPAARIPRRKSGSSRKTSARTGPPASGETDPLVAAGVAGQPAKKKRSAGSTQRRRSPKPAAETEPASAAPSTVEAGPGAYPDGSPVGDTAGRTSVEGGQDRPL